MTTPDTVNLAKCMCGVGHGNRHLVGCGKSIVECSFCDAQTPMMKSQALADAAWSRMMGDSEACKAFVTDVEKVVSTYDSRNLLSALADELDRRGKVAPVSDYRTALHSVAYSIRAVLEKKP
jgi:hypothetical protein